MDHQVIIFSKDRALQLQGTLSSLAAFCEDAATLRIKVLFAASDAKYTEAYKKLEDEFQGVLDVEWVNESQFKPDLLRMIDGDSSGRESNQPPCRFTTFLVDDNLFIRRFSMAVVHQELDRNPKLIGFSLRLGKNTSYCYSLDCPQEFPEFKTVSEDVLEYKWPGCEADFGYPLEVSSSTYRTKEIYRLLRFLPFSNPNTLEGRMARMARLYRWSRPFLQCFDASVAFCVPVNKVQSVADNRAGEDDEYSSESLNELFLNGHRIDVKQLEGFSPKACHEEIALPLTETGGH